MKELWVPVSGAVAQQRKLEAIANNVANGNTPGYKRDEVVFSEYLTALNKKQEVNLPRKEWSPDDFYQTMGAEKAFVKVAGTYTDFTSGQLQPTGNPLDLALKGPGFFEILTPKGINYTRKGNFILGRDGTLSTDQGSTILGKNEGPNRPITLPQGKLTVSQEGELFIEGKRVGQLSIVEFRDIHSLKKVSGANFVNQNTNNVLANPSNTKVFQGFLESSNVNPIGEMSELIKAHRHFGSMQNVIKAYDNIAGKGVNEIAKF